MEHNLLFYERLTQIFGIAGVIFLIAAVVLFFVFDIKGIISKLLGLTQKQALKKMHDEAKATEKAAKKVQELKKKGVGSSVRRGQTAETAVPSSRVPGQDDETTILPSGVPGQDDETTILSTGVPGQDDETTILPSGVPGQDDETTILSTGVSAQDDETEVLRQVPEKKFTEAPEGFRSEEIGNTGVLNDDAVTTVLNENTTTAGFTMVRHIMMIHTDEVIQ